MAVRSAADTAGGPDDKATMSEGSPSGRTPTSETGAGSAAESPATPTSERATEPKPETPNSESQKADAKTGLDTGLLHEGLEWRFCGPRPAGFGSADLPPPPGEGDRLLVAADTFDYDRELRLLWLQGDVRLEQGSRVVAADKVVYDRDSADLVAVGNVFLANPGVRLIAEKGQMNLRTDKGSLSGVQYRLTGSTNARGTADEAKLVEHDLTQYRNISYTTCRPGQNAWTLDAGTLTLDQERGRGVARNAKLRVRGVPVLYTPFISFPIDDRRKSGFLVPTFGNSEENGVDLTVPYYWNIAPNMDATIAPRYLSKRGLMLGTEFRFLSSRQEYDIYGEILPADRLTDDSTRWGLRVEQNGRFANRWRSQVDYNAVSDDEYLEDFGNRLELTSTRNIQRRGDLVYQGRGWRLLTRLQDFQTVDDSILPRNRPYARLPQIIFDIAPYRLDSGVELGLGTEYDYFRHDDKVFGQRIGLQPYARWPLRRSFGHLIPEVNLYVAEYDLEDRDPGRDDSPSYAIPSFNLDGELIFERSIKWLDRDALQTLEPRIFYLYTPFEEQDDIPVFDTTELTFSYFSLFRPNRFAGKDRVGDANQLTLGLTSRTIARRSGRELLRASLGQILYFKDREVQIAGPPEDAPTSSIAGVLSARLIENWTGRASFEYDPNRDEDQSRKRALELHYQGEDDRLLNLAYRFDVGRTELTRYEDTDVSFRLPVSEELKLVGRWSYSLLNSETVEAFAGMEYGRCCWRLRLLGLHLKNKPDSPGSNTVLVQVELAGLASIGQRVDTFLERGIYGYRAD